MTTATTIVGNATRDPELRFTTGGMAVCSFGVAVNRKFNDEETTSFFDVTCWGTLAEHVAETVTRGMRVICEGRLEQRSWETNDGDKRSKIEIVANSVGPDLRWATAEVTRTESTSAGGSGFKAPRSGANDYDEEPF